MSTRNVIALLEYLFLSSFFGILGMFVAFLGYGFVNIFLIEIGCPRNLANAASLMVFIAVTSLLSIGQIWFSASLLPLEFRESYLQKLRSGRFLSALFDLLRFGGTS